jgi:hypothetical protein
MAGSAWGPEDNFAPGAIILLPYVVAGFLLMYLWAQRYMGREMLLADIESNTIERAKREMKQAVQREIKEERRTTLNQVANMLPEAPLPAGRNAVMSASPEDVDSGVPEAVQALAGVDPETRADIERRYAKDQSWHYEPFFAFGPQEIGGRRLEAKVFRYRGSKRFYRVSLTLQVPPAAPAPAGNPVAAIFLLHHTMAEPIRRVPIVDGKAVLSVVCTGAFIAGAVVVGEPQTKLSLDLSKLPGAPQDFRDN